MSSSHSKKPDPDWSEVRETVKLLSLSAIQIEDLLKESDLSINTLTQAFTVIVEHMQAVNNYLLALEAGQTRDEALVCCSETGDKIHSAIVAFQFYDRMVQCLHHVTSNLSGLSQLLGNPERLHNPGEWLKFQKQIRSRYTMESEKLMFDAIFQDKSVEGALVVKNSPYPADSTDNIELF
ncbi:conserved hypothetical protein [Candidatus Methylobacter favarea]|uniref:Uncharacterized protein n=1 Tax=Candidatus Methylobacter favarea TaxID=2707345 RepID=A0A8S0WH80_9GAMM|nr:hypothetical protein [Candidatus Methylobacter favarea]CAA9889599.1 conserved hypothetical protein [Candidatus Methylobacter favarea]